MRVVNADVCTAGVLQPPVKKPSKDPVTQEPTKQRNAGSVR